MLLFLRSISDVVVVVVVVTFRPVVEFVSDVGKYPFFRLFVVPPPSSNDSSVKSVFVNRGAVTLSREFRFSNAVLPSTLLLLLPFLVLPLLAAAAVVTVDDDTDLEGGGATIPPT
jgi:hypothetical protein